MTDTDNPSRSFLSDGGEVGESMRRHDWRTSPVGDPRAWPQSLRTMVGMVIRGRTPLFMVWGPEHAFFYNDAYLDILGIKHPAALGRPFREVWSEVWDDVSPLVEQAYSGVALFRENQPFVIRRNGVDEHATFTFSYTPLHDESGNIAGLLCVLNETTLQVNAERERHAETERLRHLTDALRVSEDRVRLAVDAARLGMWSWDVVSGEVIWENDRLYDIFGIERVEAPIDNARFINEFLHSDDIDSFNQALHRTLTSGERFYFEGRFYRRPSSELRWVEFSALVEVNDEGKVTRLQGTSADITDRKVASERVRLEAEEAQRLAEANAKFRVFFDQGTYFAALMSIDGTLIEANRLCLDTCGYRREDVIGRKFWDCGWWSPSPALSGLIRDASLQASKGLTFRCETDYFLADGSRRTIDLTVAPVTDANGDVLFIAPTGTDITDHKQVEERLRLLDAISEATREATDPWAVMTDTTRLLGEHLHVTRCAYADLEPDNDRFTIRHDWTVAGAISTVGVYSLDLFGPRAAADMRSGRTLVIRDVDQELSENEGAAMFNAIGIKGLICCPLVKGGRLVAMMAVHQDAPRMWSDDEITLVEQVVERSWAHIERVRSTEALREADRMKTEFLATLAHELRNPLAPIRSGLDIMQLAGGNQATLAKVRDTMARQITHMVRLVDDLLDVARITRGKVELKKQNVELKTVIASAVEASLPLINANHHDLQLDVPDELLLLEADPTRIAQVLSNLLNNAAKYTPDGGHISLAVKRNGNDVLLMVSDDGIGIPAQSIHQIFDMFTQVPQENRPQGGLGIGLTLVRRLVELHGGTVVAFSAGPGLGSTFTVRLPLLQQTVGDDEDHGSAHALTAEDQRRVLVVDDNVDAAEMLSTLLQMEGHQTHVVHSGKEALQSVSDFQPDAIFLDIGMPGMSGYEVASALRNMPGLENILLVAVTGWGTEDDRARSKRAGFDHHLTKPAELKDVNQLLTAVK